MVSNGTIEEPQTDVTHPTDSEVVDELSSNYGVRTFLYKSSVWYDVANSFGVYVDGRVFRQDLDKFHDGLSAYWEATGTGYVVEFLFPELQFKDDSYVSLCVN